MKQRWRASMLKPDDLWICSDLGVAQRPVGNRWGQGVFQMLLAAGLAPASISDKGDQYAGRVGKVSAPKTPREEGRWCTSGNPTYLPLCPALSGCLLCTAPGEGYRAFGRLSAWWPLVSGLGAQGLGPQHLPACIHQPCCVSWLLLACCGPSAFKFMSLEFLSDALEQWPQP